MSRSYAVSVDISCADHELGVLDTRTVSAWYMHLDEGLSVQLEARYQLD